MPFESVLRTDIIDEELLEEPQRVKVVSETWFRGFINRATPWEKTKTPWPAKNIVEVMTLVSQALTDYEARTGVTEDAKVNISYESPDVDADLEVITIALAEREPGMYGQGRPRENQVKNRKPILREHLDDPDNPGYKRAVLGYFYDNTLRLTCWARTSKAANERALWLENVMEEYEWFFVYSGVNRFLYDRRRTEIVHGVGNNKIYGRPIDYFVRTEKIRNVSQKTLEEIYVRLTTRST
jgi:hypothetical protein